MKRVTISPVFMEAACGEGEMADGFTAYAARVDELAAQIMRLAGDAPVQVDRIVLEHPWQVADAWMTGEVLSADRARAVFVEGLARTGAAPFVMVGQDFVIAPHWNNQVGLEAPDAWLRKLDLTDGPVVRFRIDEPDDSAPDYRVVDRVADDHFWEQVAGDELLIFERFADGYFGTRWWTCATDELEGVRELLLPGSLVSVMDVASLPQLAQMGANNPSDVGLVVSHPGPGCSVHVLELPGGIWEEDRDSLMRRGYSHYVATSVLWGRAAVVPSTDGAIHGLWTELVQ